MNVKVGEKLTSVFLESSGTAYKRHKSCGLVDHRSYAHRPCPLCIMHDIVLSAHAHNWPLVCVGKGCRYHMSIMQMQSAHGVCALRALFFC